MSLSHRLSMDFLECTKAFLGSDTKDRAFDQHHLFLLDARGQAVVEKFFSEVQAGTNYPVVAPCLRIVSRLCKDVQATTFAILFHPVQDQLNGISESPVWSSTSAGSDSLEFDMPEFGFSPQEYITQIGQYLMTLPQHLEPYMTNENPALARAFQVSLFPLAQAETIFLGYTWKGQSVYTYRIKCLPLTEENRLYIRDSWFTMIFIIYGESAFFTPFSYRNIVQLLLNCALLVIIP